LLNDALPLVPPPLAEVDSALDGFSDSTQEFSPGVK